MYDQYMRAHCENMYLGNIFPNPVTPMTNQHRVTKSSPNNRLFTTLIFHYKIPSKGRVHNQGCKPDQDNRCKNYNKFCTAKLKSGTEAIWNANNLLQL